MCGVIGINIQNANEEDIQMIKQLFIESQIRGKHATGIAWYDGTDFLKVCKKPLPAKKFVDEYSFVFDDIINEDRSIKAVGHIRYSTSDLRYNQPIGGLDMYLAHNGVISQVNPEKWKEIYGLKCMTSNDSELLYQYYQIYGFNDFEHLLKFFPGSSFAVVYITNKGEFGYFRNSLRPLWKATYEKGTIIASTLNILLRANVPGVYEKIQPVDNIEKIHNYMTFSKQMKANEVYIKGWMYEFE